MCILYLALHDRPIGDMTGILVLVWWGRPFSFGLNFTVDSSLLLQKLHLTDVSMLQVRFDEWFIDLWTVSCRIWIEERPSDKISNLFLQTVQFICNNHHKASEPEALAKFWNHICFLCLHILQQNASFLAVSFSLLCLVTRLAAGVPAGDQPELSWKSQQALFESGATRCEHILLLWPNPVSCGKAAVFLVPHLTISMSDFSGIVHNKLWSSFNSSGRTWRSLRHFCKIVAGFKNVKTTSHQSLFWAVILVEDCLIKLDNVQLCETQVLSC